MRINIDIDELSLDNFSEGAKEKVQEQAQSYINELLKEAILIEEAERAPGASVEITSNTILIAASAKNNRNLKRIKTPFWIMICKILSTLSCTVTGFLFDAEGYQNNLMGLIFFVIFLMIACVSTAIIYVKE